MAKKPKKKKVAAKKRPAFATKASASRRKIFKPAKKVKKILVKRKTKKIIRKKQVKPRRKPKIRSIQKKKNPATKPETLPEFTAEALFRAKIKVIGIGGGGGSIVSEIGRSLQKATFVIADTDVRATSKKKSGIKYMLFGTDLTHGLGTGMNIALAEKAAEAAKEKISDNFKDQDIIIFIASLGGGLGSGATKIFADAARDFGGITVGIFTMPFRFEGAVKYRIAQNALRDLKQRLNVSLVIPNEKIFKVIDANTAITDAFSIVNKSLVNSLESLIDLIYSPGIINIDFADLKTVLKGIGNSAFLNTIEESGKDRAEKTCDRILLNPLLQTGSFQAEKILLNIAGSANLSMLEVEKISRKIAELNPGAKIIFGISKNPRLNNKIKTTILMTGGGRKEDVKKPEIEKIETVEKQHNLPEAKVKKEKAPLKQGKTKGSKKPKNKKAKQKAKQENRKSSQPLGRSRTGEAVSFIPVFQPQVAEMPAIEERKLSVIESPSRPAKTAIRRSGLEIKKAEELEEKKREAQEKEWEIPAFLRKVKYNK